ncbi:uncharacterized protein LOC121291109 isoform X1 [Carcharodon carcharias]|uniref:uncharacterized protein LOC121291109 isoform X1 n=1 Tax=Carcharodon carcharias TaxID=13397 RepID=UPI001B7D9D85|nr:uncharacterized protein LOC121291109 isoform X1 [Carcharodon carcharias]
MGRTLPPLLLLGLFLLRPLHAEAGRKEMFAAIGSSVLLDPEHEANLSNSEIIWSFTGSNGNLVTILDYVPNHPMEEPNNHFKSRLHFNSSIGSLTLNNLNPGDQGFYTFTVGEKWKWTTYLKLVEPLSQPLIASNSTCVDTTIELTCQVSEGKANSILWRKDDKELTNGQRYQLLQNNTLIISKVIKSDCGIYTCTMENPVRKKNNSYSLTIYGLTYIHQSTVACTTAAFVTAVAILLTAGATLLDKVPCLNENRKARFQFVQKKMQHFLQLAPVISFAFLFSAYVFWIQTEVCHEMSNAVTSVAEIIATRVLFAEIMGQTGPSGITRILLALLCLHLIIITFTTFNMMTCDRHMLNRILSTKICRVILGAAAPLGGIIAICVSCILTGEVMKQTGEECEPAANLQSTIIFAALMTLIILVVTFAPRKKYTEWKKWICGPPCANTRASDEHPNESQCTELKEKPLNLGQPPLNN